MRFVFQQYHSLHSFLLFALGFLLLWEWVLPLEEVLPLPVMLLFFVIVFVCSYFHISAFLTIPVYAFSMLVVIHSIHFEGSFFGFDWLFLVFIDISRLIQSIISVQFDHVSDVSRTFLFLLFLCLFGYLMRIWLLMRRNAFPFVFVTIVYVAFVDTFTPYDATFAIIRAVLTGLLLIGMLQAVKLHEREGVKTHLRFSSQWMMFVFVMVVCAVFIGIAAPKSGPKWPDPVSFLKSAANIDDDDWLGNMRVKKQGYGENDERLGGPFQPDETPVFYADVDTVHYWRAETKDFYTGKGWRSSRESFQPFRGKLSTPLYENNVNLEKKTASIEMTYHKPFTFLFYAGHPQNIIVNGSMVDLIENTASGKISTGDLAVYHYSFQYDYPTFSIDALRNVSSFSYPDEIAELYLQLPETLPERVKTLAEEITKNADNPYDKAKAIESYFRGNGFSYETNEVAVPGPNEDYVDQFLFETKKGYCDNFSTAMAVMLRSIGIPARWVKGFTGGDFVEMLDDGKRRQLITNEHAHSWVEVYFPGSGWVPFEPTPGFANPVSFESSSEEKVENAPLEQEKQPAEQQEDESQATGKEKASAFAFRFQLNGEKWLLLIGLAIAAIVFVVFRWRRLLAKRWILYRLQKKSFDSHFADWYTGLLSVLKWYGFSRKPEQTLREYARYIDDVLGTESMSVLTKVYEEIVYSNRKRIEQSDDLRTIWFTVIEKLSNVDRSR